MYKYIYNNILFFQNNVVLSLFFGLRLRTKLLINKTDQ